VVELIIREVKLVATIEFFILTKGTPEASGSIH